MEISLEAGKEEEAMHLFVREEVEFLKKKKKKKVKIVIPHSQKSSY